MINIYINKILDKKNITYMHAYLFMYLFVVYFSFAPVISASIHRYGNYFISKS